MENIHLYYCHSTNSDGHTVVMIENDMFPTDSRFFVCNLPNTSVSNVNRNIYTAVRRENLHFKFYLIP